MLTLEDVASVPLFSELPTDQLERLAKTSADLQLSAGEFAVHEGGEAALLCGARRQDRGREDVRRHRTDAGLPPAREPSSAKCRSRSARPSQVAIARPNRRASCVSSVSQYYALAAVAKEVVQKVSALARERMGGSRRSPPSRRSRG